MRKQAGQFITLPVPIERPSTKEAKKVREYKAKTISLNSDRKLINAVKKAGLETFHPRGRFNGYGYPQLPLAVQIMSVGDMRKFNKIVKILEEAEKAAKPEKVLTFEERKERWAKRLAKLTGVTFEKALEIADEKLEYHDQRIEDLQERQAEHYSKRRQTLINKLYRENPLRYIKDEGHAADIISASKRHNRTDYDLFLQIIHNLEDEGRIGRGHAKELAYQLLNGTLTLDDLRELGSN